MGEEGQSHSIDASLQMVWRRAGVHKRHKELPRLSHAADVVFEEDIPGLELETGND